MGFRLARSFSIGMIMVCGAGFPDVPGRRGENVGSAPPKRRRTSQDPPRRAADPGGGRWAEVRAAAGEPEALKRKMRVRSG